MRNKLSKNIDHNDHNTKEECRDHNEIDTRQNHVIEAIKIPVESNNK